MFLPMFAYLQLWSQKAVISAVHRLAFTLFLVHGRFYLCLNLAKPLVLSFFILSEIPACLEKGGVID